MENYTQKNHALILHRKKSFDEHARYLPNPTYEAMNVMQLLYLSDEGAIPRKVLQKFLKMNGSQLTRTNQALIKAGFIYYEVDINDHRLKLARLTALGLQLRTQWLDAYRFAPLPTQK